ncbi:response regulator transcription factor [Brotaphodocola sp.]|uniref:response regulator transcription factor n=1 Tax=Brotaphodocola sp. TaxID=3073577 RepID=UPI003D7EAF98
MKTILVVDDESMIRESVSSYLEKQGYQVFSAETGREALRIFESEQISLLVLDLMLPDLSGEEICKTVRSQSRVPIIMLTAKTMEDDMLNGLDLGADDYITKPFSLKNLYARVRAVLRRASDDLEPLAEKIFWNDGDLAVDYDRKEVYKKGRAIAVTPIEWKILMALTKYPQKVFTRENLIELVFDLDFSGYDRVIDTHVKNLRKKIEDDPKNPVYICTVHGMGYKFGSRV